MRELFFTNILSPIFLAFVLGIVARIVRSDLRIPDSIYSFLSLYLLLAIGMKGGMAIQEFGLSKIVLPACMTLGLGVVTPILSFVVARFLAHFSIEDAAALAAHYGSVSAVTFIAAQAFAERMGTPPDMLLPALVVVLEVPAIVVGLLLSRMGSSVSSHPMRGALHEVVTGKSFVLLVGGLAIGTLAGKEGMAAVKPLFVDLFKGMLVIFMLELGIVCASRLRELKSVGIPLILFSLGVPLVNAVLGAAAGAAAGLSLGGTAVLATMAASASYIAAPAAVRIALPGANPSVYITAALGITFPFNLSFGIPLYHALAALFF